MKEYINNKSWNDYLLDNICIDYGNVLINVSLDENELQIVCKNFISIQYLGQWDESIVENISIIEDDKFCQESREVVRRNNLADVVGGGTKRINDKWYHVIIKLLDGVHINIVCTEVNLSE